MAANYNGLTRNTWSGTWSPSGNHPIVLNNEIRGGIHFVSGASGDHLTDIAGQRLEEGMMVYVKNSYSNITGDKFYIYKLRDGESRNTSTGAMPNAAENWSQFTATAEYSGGSVFANITTSEIDTADSTAITIIPDVVMQASLQVDTEISSRELTVSETIRAGAIVADGSRLTNIFPDQTNNRDRYLTTTGTALSWRELPGAFGLEIDGGSAVTELGFVIDGGDA